MPGAPVLVYAHGLQSSLLLSVQILAPTENTDFCADAKSWSNRNTCCFDPPVLGKRVERFSIKSCVENPAAPPITMSESSEMPIKY